MKDLTQLYSNSDLGRCFILGNGPSLNKIDIERLRSEVSFGVNSIFLMTQTNGFRPTYYVVEDNLVYTENQEAIAAYEGVIKILPRQYAEKLTCRDHCYVFDMDTSFYNRSKPDRFGVPQFNITNMPQFYCGQSVTYINMQLAYYMGFSEVILVGMDFSYQKPPSHHQDGNHIRSHGDDPNHFHKDYFGAGKTWKDPRLGRVLRSYMRAKFEFESAGRKILNATPGGELELFPRVEFNSLF
ncbi:MAG: 6-hydroxymethylpterin diphosphokinase MptE-like protein [Candidatus Accumulibacter meliphilus]|jgi:hypothetical protein|uniref:6-hydroxymethylpterin diphosphokinase MptE-like protein n=1 Tax=Candidatus Accumulibacter meliphilus TaxID=2211374 RepID=UPI002FC301DF